MNYWRKIISLILLATVSTLAIGCTTERPLAHLHSEGEAGYIPCAVQMPELTLRSSQAFIYDVEKGEFIYRIGEDKIIYPASTTKLLTILYALEWLSPDEIITPGNELTLVPPDSSIAYIKEYHSLTVEMLIQGMLMPSGNDAAYVLAAAAGQKIDTTQEMDGITAVGVFMEGMNAYAKQIGMCGSNFATPDGYYSSNTYTTIEDIAIASLQASQNSIISKYSSAYIANVMYASGHTNTWTNTNLLLDPNGKYYSPCVTGLKTGSAGTGNYSLITTANINEKQYIIGVFSSQNKNDRYKDTLVIIDYLKNDLTIYE